jgi:Calpain family cysteine protease/Putative Ig domain
MASLNISSTKPVSADTRLAHRVIGANTDDLDSIADAPALTPADPWSSAYVSPISSGYSGASLSLSLQVGLSESQPEASAPSPAQPDEGVTWASLPEAGVQSAASYGAGALTQVLYLQETGTTAPISVTDINQGQMGDCYLLSSIGEIVLFHPSAISQMIQANADGTETVTLWLSANGSLPGYGTTAYKADAVTVTNTFPTNSVNSGATQDVLNGQKEIWVQVLEKAMATIYGGYNGIANGGIPSIAMEELTGNTATSTWAGGISLSQLQSDIAAGDLITFDTQNAQTMPYGLFGDHAYMFQSLSTVNGTVMVNLLNPWGFDNPNPVPFSLLSTVFAEVDVGQVTSHTGGPSLSMQTANQTWAQGSRVSLTLPAGAFSEPSGGKLTYTATLANGQACPSWLIFNATTLTFSGTVPAGMEALSLKVTATDANGLSCTDVFAVMVPAAAPTLAHQTAAQSWLEGSKLSFTLPSNTFADPNGQTLSYSAMLTNGQALPSWLSINSSTGTFTGTVGYTSGPLTIKVTATDTSGLSVSETLQATLVAPAPTLTHQTADQTWTAGKALSFSLASDTFTSVPGQTLTYAATLPAGLKINAATGVITGTAPVALGVNTIKVTATETSGLSVSETFRATIVASAPTVQQTTTQTFVANKGVSLSLASAFTDPQGESFTYSATLSNGSALPAGLAFNTTTGTIGGIAPTALGTLSIKVTARDQSGLSASETVQCVIAASAPTPRNVPTATYWLANQAVTFNLPASSFVDPQGEAMSYSATMANGSALPTWLKFNKTTGAFTGTAPVTPQNMAVTVTATDQSGLSAHATFQATVQAFAPTVTNQTGTVTWAAGKSVSFTLAGNTFSDPQGEKLTLSATLADGTALPGGLTFNATSGTFTGNAPITPETLGLKVTATDTSGLSVSQQFSATIQAGAPTLSQQTANQVWTAGSSMSFLLPTNAFADPQGAALSYAAFETSGADMTSWLHFSGSPAEFTGSVPGGLTGTIGIQVVATDTYGLSASESFGLTFGASGAQLVAAGAPGATEMLALHT